MKLHPLETTMRRPILLLAHVLAVLALAACGGSSSGATTTPNTASPPVATNGGGSGGSNDLDKQDLPHVVLVSLDGFRWDYQDRFATPGMDRLAATGIRAASLQPVFPTVTFPNHYSIATGLNPSSHGIVANSFPSRDRQRWYSLGDPAAVGDGTWYGGEPAWVAVEAAGMVAATYFFVGSEAAIGGIRPTYWEPFDGSVPGDVRVDRVLEWLNMPDDTRPHFIAVYFGDADSVGHQFGPDSVEIAVTVAELDRLLIRLLDGIDQSPVSGEVTVILVADHGMSTYQPGSEVLVLSDVLDLSAMSVVGGGAYAFLFQEQPDLARAVQVRDAINAVWQHGHAWLRDEAPAAWQVTPESRFPDIIVQADAGFRVVESPGQLAQLPVGLHGWAPGFTDMQGIIVAAGPRLPRGVAIDSVSVLDVYPLVLEILDIPLVAPIDGDPQALAGLLQD